MAPSLKVIPSCFGVLTVIIFLMAMANYAQAKPKTSLFGWGYSHWEGQNFTPYAGHPTHSHNRQWDFKPAWKPQLWLGKDNGHTTLNNFFENDVIRRAYTDKRVPLLCVGENFFQLSSYDQARVMDFMNYVYRFTHNMTGRFDIEDGRNGTLIGYYDDYGLRWN